MRTLDAAVIGAGPAGLYSALLLAAEGFDVGVFEEHETIGLPAHCTGVVSDEVFELFKVPDSLVLSRPAACALVAPSGRRVAIAAGDERIAVIDRAAFDAELGSAALTAGAEIRTGRRIDRVRVEPDRVVLIDARGEAIAARACVLAAGVSYGLARQLGLGLPALSLHSAQTEIDATDAPPEVELHLGRDVAPEGFGWLVPLERDGRPRARVGLMARGDAAGHLTRFLARPAIAERVGALAGPIVRRLLPLAPIARTYGDRVLAVGDAAGLTKPTTGGGIFYSLLSALMAAEVLAPALRRDALGAGSLAPYERRWKARLDPHVRVSRYLRRLFAKLGDAELDTLVGALAADDLQEEIRRTAHFNWHGDLIRALLRQPGIKPTLLRALLR